MLFYPFDDFGRDASDDAVGRYVLSDHGSCRHDGIVPDSHPFCDGGVGAYPDPLAEDDGGRVGVAPVLGSDAVVEGREDHVVPYLAAVPDYHSAVVLEMAAGIDEHILSYSDVLPEVSVQRRKHLERRIHRLPEQPREQLPYLVRLVIGAVQLEGYLPRLIAHPVHKLVYLRGIQRLPRLDEIQEFFQFHIVSYARVAVNRANIRTFFIPDTGGWVYDSGQAIISMSEDKSDKSEVTRCSAVLSHSVLVGQCRLKV